MRKEKPKCRQQIPLRMDAEIASWLREQAKMEDRSINAQINRILREAKDAAMKAAL